MTHRARMSIHGTGALDYTSAHYVDTTSRDHVAVSFTYADHDLALFLEADREILAKVAAQFRVLANQIDAAADQMMTERLRSSLLEGDQ